MLAVLAVAGASVSTGTAWRICLAVLAPVLAGLIWGLLIAPKARRRLSDPARLTVEVVLFAAAGAALGAAGHAIAAAIFAVVAIASASLLRVVAPGS